MSMSLDGFVADLNVALFLGSGVRLFDRLAGTPGVLGNPPQAVSRQSMPEYAEN